jgi:hypothetical protein
MNSRITPKVLVNPTNKPTRIHKMQVYPKGDGLSPYSPGVRVLLVDSDARSELHYITRHQLSDRVDDIRLESTIINTTAIWLSPENGEWNIHKILITEEDGVNTFMIDDMIGTTETPAIAVERYTPPGQPTNIPNMEYTKLQKQSLDTQLIATCVLNMVCLLFNPNYSICLLISSTVGTLYLFLLEKQVESLGRTPLISIMSYQTRMLILNAFIIYSFLEYKESRDLNYLLVSATGFSLYRLTLLFSASK